MDPKMGLIKAHQEGWLVKSFELHGFTARPLMRQNVPHRTLITGPYAMPFITFGSNWHASLIMFDCSAVTRGGGSCALLTVNLTKSL